MEQDGDDDGWWACAVIESAAGDAIIDILTTQLLRGDLKLMPLFPTILFILLAFFTYSTYNIDLFILVIINGKSYPMQSPY